MRQENRYLHAVRTKCRHSSDTDRYGTDYGWDNDDDHRMQIVCLQSVIKRVINAHEMGVRENRKNSRTVDIFGRTPSARYPRDFTRTVN